VHETLRLIRKVSKEMEKEIGRAPSLLELANRLEMPPKKIQLYTDSSRTVLSLEVPVNAHHSFKDDKRTLGDKIAAISPSPEEDAEFDSLRQEIWSMIEDGLTKREGDVVVCRFGLENGQPRSVEETSKLLGISRDRVRNLEAHALNKLRHPQYNYKLKDYVEESIETDEEGSKVKNESLSPEKIWSL